MPKIIIQPDCGNAPRKIFLKEFNVALANGNLEFLKENIPDKISWEIAGKKTVTGKENYLKEVVRHKICSRP